MHHVGPGLGQQPAQPDHRRGVPGRAWPVRDLRPARRRPGHRGETPPRPPGRAVTAPPGWRRPRPASPVGAGAAAAGAEHVGDPQPAHPLFRAAGPGGARGPLAGLPGPPGPAGPAAGPGSQGRPVPHPGPHPGHERAQVAAVQGPRGQAEHQAARRCTRAPPWRRWERTGDRRERTPRRPPPPRPPRPRRQPAARAAPAKRGPAAHPADRRSRAGPGRGQPMVLPSPSTGTTQRAGTSAHRDHVGHDDQQPAARPGRRPPPGRGPGQQHPGQLRGQPVADQARARTRRRSGRASRPRPGGRTAGRRARGRGQQRGTQPGHQHDRAGAAGRRLVEPAARPAADSTGNALVTMGTASTA